MTRLHQSGGVGQAQVTALAAGRQADNQQASD